MADTAAPVKIGDFSAKKPELPKNVGHLLQDPVEIDCPACRKHNVTRVDKIPVTIWQKLISLINSCCACW